ncbi:glycosyltransferase family 1 protein [Coleofasciculus sp. E1-EBD-02]|uniref:glycosyltransferase family 1 protein n=1 Tax=Coleofasciculus sp. E1-EBD-02 TaxID=3068481 RepID=UPI0032FD9504
MSVLVQIVPRLPPAVDGLGDYSLNLARQLRQDCEIETHFVVGDPGWTGATEIEGFTISQGNKRSANALVSILSSSISTVLLHYVGYGYAQRGCPLWLVNGLQRWRTASANHYLVTMFHEVYASGSPWTSAFWLSPWQRNLAARLARLSDKALTTNQIIAQILDQLLLDKPTPTPSLPVFSNIGEPKQLLPLAERPRQLIVFGTPGIRRRVYQESLTSLNQICDQLAIERIYDVGSPLCLDISHVNGVPVVATGKIGAAAVSTLLSNALVGFLDYPTHLLAKSTIFAAYCAHRLIPVVATTSTIFQIDGLEAGKHYWLTGSPVGKLSLATGQAIADNAHCWYQTHNLSIQAQSFATYLSQKETTERVQNHYY